MIHQPLGGVEGQATDIQIRAREIVRVRSQLTGILARHTGRSAEDIGRDMERDHFMTAEDAREYGVVDAVIERRR